MIADTPWQVQPSRIVGPEWTAPPPSSPFEDLPRRRTEPARLNPSRPSPRRRSEPAASGYAPWFWTCAEWADLTENGSLHSS